MGNLQRFVASFCFAVIAVRSLPLVAANIKIQLRRFGAFSGMTLAWMIGMSRIKKGRKKILSRKVAKAQKGKKIKR